MTLVTFSRFSKFAYIDANSLLVIKIIIIIINQSYLSSTPSTSGGAAEAAADRKSLKYTQLAQTYIFVPIAMETFGPLNMAGFQFLSELGRRISQESDNSPESVFLFQRLSMTIQRFNAVAIQGTFVMRTPTEVDISDIEPFQQICSH